jgi:hypothetical protein
MRARHRALAVVLAFMAGLAVPAAAQPASPSGPTVWTPALASNEGFERLSAFPDGVMYAQYGEGYARSTDFGAHWSMATGPDGQTGNSGMLRWSSPRRGFAVVSRSTPALSDPVSHEPCPLGLPSFALDITTDSGKNWSPACAPTEPATQAAVGAIEVSPEGLYVSRRDSSVMVAGDTTGPNCRTLADVRPVLFTTSDFGRDWRTITLPRGYANNLLGYDIYDSRHIAVIVSKVKGTCASYQQTGAMYVFATTDGRHFKRVFRCPGVRYCTSSAWVTPERLLVGLDDGQLYVSNNRGGSFFKGALLRDADYDPLIASGAVDPRMFWAQALSFSDSRHGYASTRGSGTWRTTDGGLRWVQEKSPECVYYPFGVGDISAGDAEHGITGGPPSLDVRQPGQVELGCLAPQSGGPQIAAGAVTATEVLPTTTEKVARLNAIGRTSITAR